MNVTANNISSGGALTAGINNSANGTIGLDAAVNVSAASISTVGPLNDAIGNSGGTIAGSANLSFNLSGDLTTQGDTGFAIDNSNGGMIGADAGMTVSAASISAGGALFADISKFWRRHHRRECQYCV